MSTTEKYPGSGSGTDRDPALTGAGALRRPAVLAGIAVSVALGVLIWGVGLHGSGTLWDTPIPDLTVPAALLVTLTGISLVGVIGHPSRWRVVDAVVASVLAVAGGLMFWGVAALYTALKLAPPSVALLAGLWLLPGVLGALVIRKPGAALYTELVAAVLEALLGDQFGFSSVYYGAVQGLGVEFVLALLFYRRFGLVPAALAGAAAGVAEALLDLATTYPDLTSGVKTGYLVLATASGAVLAGGGAWALTRALAGTGALAPLASGRSAERV